MCQSYKEIISGENKIDSGSSMHLFHDALVSFAERRVIYMKINLKITTQCPADCLCCKERLNNFSTYYKNMDCTDTLIDQILKLYELKGDKLNHLSITGGEPTLVAKLPIYVKKIVNSKVTVGIDTNGWNIDENWLMEMERSGLSYILLSVYSMKKDKFNYLRGSCDGKLYSCMRKAIELLKKYKENGGKIQIRFQCVLMKQNYEEMPELLTCAIESGFDTFSTSYYISNNPDENLLMSKNDIDNFIFNVVPKVNSILSKCNTNKIVKKENLKKINSFFKFDGISLETVGKGVYRLPGTTCEDRNRIAIYPNGDVVPCLGFDYKMQQKYKINIFNSYSSLNIINSNFDNFWNSNYDMCSRCSSGFQVWFTLK